MKLSLQLQSFIDLQCKKYSEQMGIESPLIIFSDEELQETEFVSKSVIKKVRNTELGRSWVKGNIPTLDRDLIFINVEGTDFLWQIIDVIVHELVHIKYPDLEHGDKFQERINEIILSGKI